MTFRLATFNLENLDDEPGQDPPLAARIAVLRPQLLRIAADVLCLQEVNGQRHGKEGPRRLTALDALLADTPYGAFARVVTTGAGGGVADRHNLVILSRTPILSARPVRHDLVPAPSYRAVTASPPAAEPEPVTWDRPLLQAEIDLGSGRVLNVINVHLRAPLAAPVAGQKTGPLTWASVGGWAEGFYLATMKRGGQALEARLLVERMFDGDENALVAVVGDFNAEDGETPLRTVRGDVEDTANGRLAGRALVSLDRTVPESQRFTVLHRGRRLMLDHVLASRSLMAAYRHTEIHNESLGDELVAFATGSRSPESFHAPVVVEFRFDG